ncbi:MULTISPECIES: sugar ABC transporter permease [unclassified Mesorhizobium]|uniref:carbohydrate ABC transporter permease n=1 Tax=unclassified Mesorhizobium TaxID=325217 RepID=UPI000FCC0EC8|nr:MULTISPECIES: sugar ABC transporter permease [unclassified Mesorhizobium]RUU66129.1 sugar ABC transporter permease [Mesorhizobium sp. M7A.T.Ca.TU.009.01.1.1]RUU75484.1 sugar ABC transporter permease [Mesorhizobium sp. M7A.T.Ca.TU.009.01.1.2]MCQ8871805.1 sugar ABC transporter permease [Mesorhizobium sp. LMG17149]RUT89422.1 sugar ABC transporter permease [Mesorhizobium sp. M7A.T.Ca.US.000.02.1.1]RUT92046.1 sugar ABC transporter permease [Mesorhizobium sp. M7A.T.Ca.US.000.02.2.1]
MFNAIKKGLAARGREWRTGWAFALPGLLLLAIVMGFPLAYACILSISSMTLIKPQLLPLVGFKNFASMIGDDLFWNALWLTVRYSAVTVVGEFVIGLGIALMLNRTVRMKPVYFAVLTIPMAMSPISVALIWRMLLQPNLGIANHLMETFGLPRLDWLGTPGMALWTMAAIDIWQQMSFVVLILAAGLAALPRDPYEAAEVDGARGWQQFFYITLPMLRPVAAITIIIQLINEFRTYDLPYVLTKGGPGNATEVLSFFAYRRAFLGLSLNEGAAAAFVLLLIVLLLTVIFFAVLERSQSGEGRK